MDSEERKKWLKWSKIGICVPLKNKSASEKDLHMANTLERLENLQEEMAANFNNFLRVQRTRRKRKSKRQGWVDYKSFVVRYNYSYFKNM